MPSVSLETSFAARFGLTTPIALAPMANATGGALAAACAKAGALGLVGGGYGDLDWTRREYMEGVERLSSNSVALDRLGCGFITWKLEQDRSALDWLLDQPVRPAAIMLSFGDPSGIARSIVDRGIPLICQIQTLTQLPQAVDAGATVIVAQGSEAGGHGMNALDGRSTFTLIPEISDWLAREASAIKLLAAGGIADGRGLAAALMLGAEGALVGSRLWATEESLAPTDALEQAIAAEGDGTARSKIFDILLESPWPAEFDFRTLRNRLHREWEHRIPELAKDPGQAIGEFREGVRDRDFDRAHVAVGEGVGLIRDITSAADVIAKIDLEARELLG